MDDWLVSVVKGEKVVELYLSNELRDASVIRALHPGCELEAMRIGHGLLSNPIPDEGGGEEIRLETKRVRCVETREVYPSALVCGEKLGIPRWNIYKSIQRGITAGGLHFEYV